MEVPLRFSDGSRAHLSVLAVNGRVAVSDIYRAAVARGLLDRKMKHAIIMNGESFELTLNSPVSFPSQEISLLNTIHVISKIVSTTVTVIIALPGGSSIRVDVPHNGTFVSGADVIAQADLARAYGDIALVDAAGALVVPTTHWPAGTPAVNLSAVPPASFSYWDVAADGAINRYAQVNIQLLKFPRVGDLSIALGGKLLYRTQPETAPLYPGAHYAILPRQGPFPGPPAVPVVPLHVEGSSRSDVFHFQSLATGAAFDASVSIAPFVFTSTLLQAAAANDDAYDPSRNALITNDYRLLDLALQTKYAANSLPRELFIESGMPIFVRLPYGFAREVNIVVIANSTAQELLGQLDLDPTRFSVAELAGVYEDIDPGQAYVAAFVPRIDAAAAAASRFGGNARRR